MRWLFIPVLCLSVFSCARMRAQDKEQPVAYFAGVTGRAEVEDCKMHAAQGVYVMLGNEVTTEWQCTFYTIFAMMNEEPVKTKNHGAALDSMLKGFLSSLKAGEMIAVGDIKLEGPENAVKNQEDIIINLIECDPTGLDER